MPIVKESEVMWQTAEALDKLEGAEAVATHMRFLAGYSYDRISLELGLPHKDCQQLALGGLKRIKDHVFEQK